MTHAPHLAALLALGLAGACSGAPEQADAAAETGTASNPAAAAPETAGAPANPDDDTLTPATKAGGDDHEHGDGEGQHSH
jgi:hypothetical protein